jgi:hypothetical protein
MEKQAEGKGKPKYLKSSSGTGKPKLDRMMMMDFEQMEMFELYSSVVQVDTTA